MPWFYDFSPGLPGSDHISNHCCKAVRDGVVCYQLICLIKDISDYKGNVVLGKEIFDDDDLYQISNLSRLILIRLES